MPKTDYQRDVVFGHADAWDDFVARMVVITKANLRKNIPLKEIILDLAKQRQAYAIKYGHPCKSSLIRFQK